MTNTPAPTGSAAGRAADAVDAAAPGTTAAAPPEAPSGTDPAGALASATVGDGDAIVQGAGGSISMPNVAGVGLPEDENPWAKKGALIVAGGKVEGAGDRMVIVVGTRVREAAEEPEKVTRETIKDALRNPVTPPFKEQSYPKTADAYLRADDTIDFGVKDDRPVFTLGGNLLQAGFSGLSNQLGAVCVGPASPVYAAVNLAYLFGARDVKVVGLDDEERERIRPALSQKLVSEQFTKLTF